MFRVCTTNECDLHKLISHYVISRLDSATKYKPSFNSRILLVNTNDDREILANHIIQRTCSRGGRSPFTTQRKVVSSLLFFTNKGYLLAHPRFYAYLRKLKLKLCFWHCQTGADKIQSSFVRCFIVHQAHWTQQSNPIQQWFSNSFRPTQIRPRTPIWDFVLGSPIW